MGNKNSRASAGKNMDAFIVKFNKKNAHSIRLNQISNKTVIFISLIGLYQTYNQCPPHVLYSSLLIMPLKRQWIYAPSRFVIELHSASSGLIVNDAESREFLDMLRWKDYQNLVVFAKDEHNNDNINTTASSNGIIHPFWYNLSRKIASLCDPMTLSNYKPIQFDRLLQNDSSYGAVSLNEILLEIHCVALKFERVKQIINESNPGSFDVMTWYNNDIAVNHFEIENMVDTDDDGCDEEQGEFWVVSDY